MRKSFGISVFLLITLSLVPFASANLIDNGSFESPVIAGTYAFVPAASLPGWSFAGAYQELEIQKNGLYAIGLTFTATSGPSWMEI